MRYLSLILLVLGAIGCAKAPDSPNWSDGRFHNLKADLESGDMGPLDYYWARITSEEYQDWPESVPATQVRPEWAPVKPGQAQVMLVGHAATLIRLPQANLLIDPHFSKRASPFSFAGPKRIRPPALRFADLPPIDYVLISHNHYDHLDLPTLHRLQKAHNPKFFVPLEVGRLMQSQGIGPFAELDWWDEAGLPGLKLHFVPSQHFSARSPFDRFETLWGGWYLTTKELKFYHAGDTAYGPHFELIQKKLGAPDLAFLPIGAYVPWGFMQHHHINPEQAVQAHLALGAKRSMGMHWGFFPLTGEPWDEPPKRLKAELKRLELDLKQFSAPDYGELFTLSGGEPESGPKAR